MKTLTTAAFFLLGAASFGQSAEWFAARFGFNAPAADLFANQSASDYKNFVFNSGNSAARWNNSSAMMLGSGVQTVSQGLAWNNPTNHLWSDLYEMTDLLPKNTWVRVTGNLGNHFPNPYNPKGQVNRERNLQAIIGRIMFRGTDLSNGLNILWNITPGVYPNTSAADAWSSIGVDPNGNVVNNLIALGDPARRDWWRPSDEFLPYLKNHVQSFVYDANNAAADIVRQRSGTGNMTENFVARMSFQMGNEPAAGHPGGSIDGAVGSWTGVGKVLEQTMASVDYRPSAATIAADQVPATFGSNSLAMPAFSMFSETTDSYRVNYVKGQLRNIQWGGSVAPALNELATYGDEMNNYTWPGKCRRRALHFNSPVYRWKFNATSTYSSVQPNDLLASRPFDPSQGRWETAAEYAKRWVDELEKQVNIVASLSMPTKIKTVDVTECYFSGAQSAATWMDSATTYNGGSVSYATMSFDQLRSLARSTFNDGNVLKKLQQMPESRENILAAIRTELYNRDMAKTLNPNLGRIYWWGGYYNDPRLETGLGTDASNNVNSYNPWADYRLTLSEVKALWNVK